METDKRKSDRRDIELPVRIETPDGSPIAGVVADISQSGACLKIGNVAELPERFALKLAEGIQRWCRVVWRGAGEAGLEFVAGPEDARAGKFKYAAFFKCPRTARHIPTGIDLITAADLRQVSSVRRFTRCPDCKVVHGWLPAEAFVKAKPERTARSAKA